MASYITVECPHCSNRMRASAEFLGRQGRCPSCKALVEIAAAGADETVALTQSREAAAASPTKSGVAATDVPAWLSGLIGAGITIALYLLVFLPLSNTRFGQHFGDLFVHRGIVPYVVVLVTSWGMATLALKFLAVRRQQSYADLELELIPLDIGLQITPANVDQFIGHLSGLPSDHRYSILGRRIEGALDHFKSRNNVPEVQEFLSTQSEIDASGVDSGYTLLRSFIWAIPILGFIGTVMGISDAVTGLSSTLGAGGDIMTGLGGVTSGLSTAFDTTLVALVMAILLLFPTESLRKTEYRMLDRIETFANESLLRRMSDDKTSQDIEELPDVVKLTLESAFKEHQRWLAQWQTQVAELGRVIGADFEDALGRIQEMTVDEEVGKTEQLQEAVRILGDVLSQVSGSTDTWQRTEQKLAQGFAELFNVTENLKESLSATAQVGQDLMTHQAETLQTITSTDVAQTMNGLREDIRGLTAEIHQQDQRRIAAGDSDGQQEIAPLEQHPDARHGAGQPKQGGGLFNMFRKS